MFVFSKNKLSGLFLAFALLVFVLPTKAQQTKAELQKKKSRILKEIQYTNKLIKETAQKTESTVSNVKLIQSKITSRQELINTIGQEINLLDKKIDENENVIQSLQNDLKSLKDEYAKMIYYAWKNRSAYTRLMFIFSAQNFNQAYQRMKYLQEYAAYREKQAKLIVETQKSLQSKVANLQTQKKQRASLLSSKEQEKLKLSKEKSQQENTIAQLQGKQKDLKRELRKKQQKAQELDRAIAEIIKKEIEAARRAAKAKNKNSSNKGFPLSPEAQKLSASFAANKGKLPWPVKQGVITSTFGKHPHPVLKGVYTNNNGIDISTDKGATVRAIFKGKVTGIIIIPGEGKCVMVRHGEYLSVYTYLSRVFVNKGDEVNTKQDLGVLVERKTDAKSDMHLEIWKGITKLDPQYWILSR